MLAGIETSCPTTQSTGGMLPFINPQQMGDVFITVLSNLLMGSAGNLAGENQQMDSLLLGDTPPTEADLPEPQEKKTDPTLNNVLFSFCGLSGQVLQPQDQPAMSKQNEPINQMARQTVTGKKVEDIPVFGAKADSGQTVFEGIAVEAEEHQPSALPENRITPEERLQQATQKLQPIVGTENAGQPLAAVSVNQASTAAAYSMLSETQQASMEQAELVPTNESTASIQAGSTVFIKQMELAHVKTPLSKNEEAGDSNKPDVPVRNIGSAVKDDPFSWPVKGNPMPNKTVETVTTDQNGNSQTGLTDKPDTEKTVGKMEDSSQHGTGLIWNKADIPLDKMQLLEGKEPVSKDLSASMQVCEKITAMLKESRGKKAGFQMKLYPEGLGEIHVTLTGQSGKISLEILTDNPSTQKLLASQANELKAALLSKNYEVTDFQVGTRPEAASTMNNPFSFMQWNPGGSQQQQNPNRYGEPIFHEMTNSEEKETYTTWRDMGTGRLVLWA